MILFLLILRIDILLECEIGLNEKFCFAFVEGVLIISAEKDLAVRI